MLKGWRYQWNKGIFLQRFFNVFCILLQLKLTASDNDEMVFYINQWFAVDEGDGQILREFPVISPDVVPQPCKCSFIIHWKVCLLWLMLIFVLKIVFYFPYFYKKKTYSVWPLISFNFDLNHCVHRIEGDGHGFITLMLHCVMQH